VGDVQILQAQQVGRNVGEILKGKQDLCFLVGKRALQCQEGQSKRETTLNKCKVLGEQMYADFESIGNNEGAFTRGLLEQFMTGTQ